MSEPIDICITLDIEFDINGAFADPDRFSPAGIECVYRDYKNRSQGLGFVLDTLRDYDLKATFFIEVFNVYYFGDEPMAAIVEDILKAGHDIQLHLHGCWLYFKDPNWRETVKRITPHESIADYSIAEVVAFLQEGQEIYQRLTGQAPLALRMGGLQVENNLYPAMEQAGIFLSSNIGVAVYPPPQQALHLYSGVHRIGQVTEAPVLGYQDYQLLNRVHLKNLTITGSSWTEMKALLEQAWARQIQPVVLLTHACEFAQARTDGTENNYYPDTVNQARFRQFCTFIAQQPDKYNAVTFSQRAAQWQQRNETKNDLLQTPIHGLAQRLFDNKIKSPFYQRMGVGR